MLAAGGAILFASKGLFSKTLHASGVDYLTVTTVRALLSLPLFGALAVWRGMSLHKAPRGALLRAALAGALCYGAGALVDFRALELIDVSLERALLFSYPALIVAWQALVRRRMPSGAMLLALTLTYAGILLVVGGFDPELWRQNLLGASMVMFCAATTASYFLLGERAIADLGSSGFTIVAMAAAALCVTLVHLVSRPVAVLWQLDAQQWLLLSALAVLCMFLPTLLQAEAIRRIGAQRSALAGTIGPPAALGLGVLMLGERPGTWQIAGTVLVLAGILLLARRNTGE